jgi:hypothetical protein
VFDGGDLRIGNDRKDLDDGAQITFAPGFAGASLATDEHVRIENYRHRLAEALRAFRAWRSIPSIHPFNSLIHLTPPQRFVLL